MKVKPIPTSPKNHPDTERDRDVEAFMREPQGITKPAIVRFSVGFLLLTVGVSFLAGAVGAAVIVFGREQWAWLARWTGVTSTEQPAVRTVTRKEATPALSDTVKALNQSVVGIYVRRVSVAAAAPLLDQLYLPADRRGAGVLLTEDGVGVTTRRAIPDLTKEVAVVTYDKTVYLTKDFFVDPASDLVFFRLSARGLPVVDFANLDGLSLGGTLLDVSRQATTLGPVVTDTSLTTLQLQRVNTRTDVLRSSEQLSALLQAKASTEVPGVPTFTVDGKLVGLHTGTDGDLIPVDVIQSGVERLQKTGQVSRNVLGVRYLDLTVAKGLLLKPTSVGETGALLVGDASGAAVVAKSPADRAGLKAGDVILKVNDTVLTSTLSLSDAIQQLPARAVASLTYRRDGKEQTVPITLDVTTP